MAGKKSTNGPTGATVAQNIRRIREEQNLTFAELSRRLSDAGRPIPELGLRNIERGQRKVDSDELVALAFILRTSPINLLMPNTPGADDEVTGTGVGETTARQLWNWLQHGSYTNSNGTHVIPFHMGPDWWVNESPPEDLQVSQAFRKRLKTLGLNLANLAEEIQSDGDD